VEAGTTRGGEEAISMEAIAAGGEGDFKCKKAISMEAIAAGGEGDSMCKDVYMCMNAVL
jgi:hypothetical protein